jgi:diguanylate cyclase (GGDEF)-like protein
VNEAVRLEDVLNQIYDALRGTIPFDRIGLALVDDDLVTVRAVWARGEREPTGIPKGYEARLDATSLKDVLESGKPRIISDLESYFHRHPGSDSTRRILDEGLRSSLTCPLRAFGRPVGFLFFSSFDRNAYNASHTAFFRQLAGQVSLAITKSRLYEDLLETKARLETANHELEALATADGLTGLANRRAFDQALEYEWRRATRTGKPLSLLLADVDSFKAFNDRYGHLAGDDCLRRVAGMLALTVRRAGDIAARYGGEEFAVLLPDTSLENAAAIAEEIRRNVQMLGIAHDQSAVAPVVTVSLGFASITRDGSEEQNALVSAADAALYEAKSGGRNRVVAAALDISA